MTGGNAASETGRQVRAILTDPAFDDPACDQNRPEAIWELVERHGWEPVRDEMLALLEDEDAQAYWVVATTVIWLGVERAMPAPRVIALLHLRLLADVPAEQALDENLVWSIVHTLKRVDYLSDYYPASDPAVQEELARLRGRREGGG